MLTILRNAEVFAPGALGRQDLIVAAGKIVWLGAEAPEVPVELVAEETDLNGARLIPGLVDCHVHLTGGGGEAGPASRVPPLTVSQFTRAGTTSVVGLLGTDTETRDMTGLVAATRGLVQDGLSAWCWTGGYQIPPVTLTGSVRGDIVHIDRIIGLGELAVSDHRSGQPTLNELLRLAAEAHVGGLLTGKAGIVHLHVGDGKRGLDLVRRALEKSELPARVFHPTHVNRHRALFDEALELAGRGCPIDVTAFPPIESPVERDDEIDAVEAVERYLDSGLDPVLLTVSSDAGGSLPEFDPHGQVVRMGVAQPAAMSETLQRLLDRGRGLAEVLPAFTANPADLLRLSGKGRLAVGADADLAVLDAAGRATEVMALGKWQVRSGRVEVKSRFE